MFWLQALITFGVWIGFGVGLARRSPAWRDRLDAMPRGTRGLLGAGLLFSAAASMLGGLFVIERMGGYAATRMEPWDWAVTTALGLLFVAAQVIASAILVTLIRGRKADLHETDDTSAASGNQDS